LIDCQYYLGCSKIQGPTSGYLRYGCIPPGKPNHNVRQGQTIKGLRHTNTTNCKVDEGPFEHCISSHLKQIPQDGK